MTNDDIAIAILFGSILCIVAGFVVPLVIASVTGRSPTLQHVVTWPVVLVWEVLKSLWDRITNTKETKRKLLAIELKLVRGTDVNFCADCFYNMRQTYCSYKAYHKQRVDNIDFIRGTRNETKVSFMDSSVVKCDTVRTDVFCAGWKAKPLVWWRKWLRRT